MAGNDFVMVQLSVDGAALAKASTVRVSNGRRTFSFTPGVAQRVERSYEWLAVLSRQVTPNGKKLFELAPDAVSLKPATPAATAAASSAPAPIAPVVPIIPVAAAPEETK